MDTKARAMKIYQILSKLYPYPKTVLAHEDPFQLMIATILSAQCTDARVNLVTPALFKRYRTPKDFANAKIPELEKMIHSTGFYHNKAKSIKNGSKYLVSAYKGKVPSTLPELIKIPGVGRKTANIILTYGFGKTQGIAVDTHVFRLTHLLKLTNAKDANKTADDLEELFPKKTWPAVNHVFVLHGRQICVARRPNCKECKVNKLCPSSRVLSK